MWAHHMRRGEFDAAWAISDAVLNARKHRICHHLPRHEQWIWNGTPLHHRRVLVRCYHGLGDTIQFIRYIPLLKSVAAEVAVWAQPSLIPLLHTMTGLIDFRPLHDGTPDYPYDVDIELMELPHFFRTTIETMPREVPYLHVQPAPLQRDGRLSVGIFPRAGDWDPRRSIPPHAWSALQTPGARLHMLARDAIGQGQRDHVEILNGPDDMLATAALMKAFDLVISVDSMPAHLSGALGVPTWTLLHTAADWRWMESRSDSPWYPTMRLFRQERTGDWQGVMNRVADALNGLETCRSLERRAPPSHSARRC
jgi:hypothetical protein